MTGGEVFFDSLGFADIPDKYNVAIIAPSLGNGYFSNSSYERQADFLNEELMPTMHSSMPISPKKENNMLLGISMGGFGAMRWALDAPEHFCAVAAISGVFDIRLPVDERARKNREQRPLVKLFTEKLMPWLFLDENGILRPEVDVDKLIASLASTPGHCPRLVLFCGNEDYISLNQTVSLAEKCKKQGIITEVNFTPGGHNQQYWRSIVQNAVIKIIF
jgi:enterochelin esterase-like enzyme